MRVSIASAARAGIAFAIFAGAAPSALAQTVTPTASTPTNSARSQSSLLDVAGGPKQLLMDAGVDLNVSLTQFYQGLVGGQGSKTWQYGGKVDVFANFSGEKLGLWQGFSVNVHSESVYGNDVNTQGDGSIFPLNTALALPASDGHDNEVSVFVRQTFGTAGSLSVGKFNMLDVASRTPLIGGGGIDTFMNLSLAAPASGVTPPYIFGGMATLRTEPATFTLMVYDPRDAQDWNVIQHPFQEGATTSLSATVPIQIKGLTGFQSLRAVYSTQDGLDLTDIPQIALPPESQALQTKDSYWYLAYSFQQYLIQSPSNPSQGWGVFGQIAVSDGNPNPFAWSGYIGLGGTSLLPGRPDDRFGVAYFRNGLSPHLINGLNTIGIDLGDEQGFEAFYNYAATRWLNLTVDCQVVKPSLSNETAFFLGGRAQLKLF